MVGRKRRPKQEDATLVNKRSEKKGEYMKREEIKKVFPDATDEQISIVMGINGADVEKAKSKVTALEADLREKTDAFDKLTGEFETLKSNNASGEDWKARFEALKAENDAKERQAEADRILKEKQEGIAKRFNDVVGEKNFINEFTRDAYLDKFSKALEDKNYEGMGDDKIFHDLVKDDSKAFEGTTVIRLAGGRPRGTNLSKYTSASEIMAIKNRTERQAEMLAHPELFPELAN